jgi:hypothetical protein
MEITEFIRARISEDEELATAASEEMPLGGHRDRIDAHDPVAEFLAQWNPEHVMYMCMLRRHGLQTHRPIVSDLGWRSCATCDDRRGRSGWPCRSLLLLANEWLEHPAFHVEWALTRRHTLLVV